jgi:hypothetical protein
MKARFRRPKTETNQVFGPEIIDGRRPDFQRLAFYEPSQLDGWTANLR